MQAGKLFARSTIPFAVLMGLAFAAPAGAQELVDVAALEASLEAASEPAELPAEPDWGVTESVESVSTPADAPQVPVVSDVEPAADAVEAAADATEARYQTAEPQYHAEYQAPDPEPVHEDPQPASEPAQRPAEPAPVTDAAQTEPAYTQTRVTEPPESSETPAGPPAPASTPAPEQPATSATPTIWIWVWNWTWTTVNEVRYQAPTMQYQIDDTILGTDVPLSGQGGVGKSTPSSVPIPLQTDVKTGIDIVDAIQRDISPVATIRETVREVERETRQVVREATEGALGEAEVALEDALRPLSAPAPTLTRSVEAGDEAATSASVRKRTAHARAFASQSAHGAEAVASSSSASYFASGDTARAVARVSRHTKRTAARARLHQHRAAAPKAPPPTNEERLGDATTANGGGVGFLLKTIAILTAFMLLAALGYGLRIWLPETRLRGLLGTRTDPPG